MSNTNFWPEYKVGQLVTGTQSAVIEKVGQGSQAEVYLVRDLFLERVGVMKLFRAQVHTDQAVRDFRAEAIKQAAMKHPNIVEVVTGGMTKETPPRPFFLMAYHKGKTLEAILRRMHASDRVLREEHRACIARGEPSMYEPQWVTIRDAADVCIQVCAALTHAHVVHGLLHRDVKPGNLLITEEEWDAGSAKLFDFGIAKLTAEIKENPDPSLYGTLRYCGPEQLYGRACEQSDLYAVAGIFYEMISGSHVFAEAKTLPELVKAVAKQPPVPISKRMTNVSPRLEAFFMKNLHKNPAQRAVSAREMAKEIRAIADEYDAEGTTDATNLTLGGTTERMAFRAARKEGSGPSEEELRRTKLDSFWDSATGTPVELGTDGLPRGPRVFHGKAVDTDPMHGDEIAARARAVAEELERRRSHEEAALKAAEQAELEAARERAKAWANATPEQRAEIRRQRTRTTPMGPLARPADEGAPPEKVPAVASVAPVTREQTNEERSTLERERLERERANEEAMARAKAQSIAKARENFGLSANDQAGAPAAPANGDPLPRARAALTPDPKPARMGDTDPSRVEPFDAKNEVSSREAASVKIVPGAPAASGGPPPTERLADADAVARSTAELQAHIKNGTSASRRTSTTPMADAPGRSIAPAAASRRTSTTPMADAPGRSVPAPAMPSAGARVPEGSRGERWSNAQWALFVSASLVVIGIVTWIVVAAVMDSSSTPAHLDVGAAPMVTEAMPAPPAPSSAATAPTVTEAVTSPPLPVPAVSSAKPSPQKLAPLAAPRSMPSVTSGPKRVPRGESPKVGM